MSSQPEDQEVPLVDPGAIADYSIAPIAWAGATPEAGAWALVEQLLYAYSYAWDARLPEETAALFTEDAEVSFFLDGATSPTHLTSGRANLLKEMRARTDLLKRWKIETRHIMSNHLYGPTENDQIQVMTTAMIYWQQMPDHPQPQPVQTGYYKSWVDLAGDTPKFSRRETHMTGVFHPRQVYGDHAG